MKKNGKSARNKYQIDPSHRAQENKGQVKSCPYGSIKYHNLELLNISTFERSPYLCTLLLFHQDTGGVEGIR